MGVNHPVSVLKHLRRPTNNLSKPEIVKAITRKILTYLYKDDIPKAVSFLVDSPDPIPFYLYARLFKLCSSPQTIVEARKVESHLLSSSLNPPFFLLNRAIESYGKCGCLADARGLFEEMPQKDGGSWNAIITAYSQGGCPYEVLCLFSRMHRCGVSANEVTFANVLGSCAALLALSLSRQIHGLTLKCGYGSSVILETSLVDVYGKCKVISDARRKFDEINNPNEVTWNVIVRRYLEMDDALQAVSMFFRMVPAAIRPLTFTFSNALVACSVMLAIKEGIQIHGMAIKMGFDDDVVVMCSLIDMYVKCGLLEHACAIMNQPNAKNLISWTSIVSGLARSGNIVRARRLFNKMPERNVVSWNAMLTGYIHSCLWEDAFDFVFLMVNTHKYIDHVTLGLILNMCVGLSDLQMGKQVHGFIYRHGFYSNILVSNALFDMYRKCGNLRSAQLWFNHMRQLQDNVSLTGYAHHQMSEQAVTMSYEMQRETRPSNFTFGTLLAACANVFALEQGRQIHGFMITNGYDKDIVVRRALLDMYSKCKCLTYALTVFEEGNSRNLILWNSMIMGCCYNGRGKEVLILFELLEEEGIKPDHVTFQGLLIASICEGLVEFGTECFNSMANEYGITPRIEHYESMIELYGRYDYMDELESFVSKMPFEITTSMLTRIIDVSIKDGYLRLEKWAVERFNKMNPKSTCPSKLWTHQDLSCVHY